MLITDHPNPRPKNRMSVGPIVGHMNLATHHWDNHTPNYQHDCLDGCTYLGSTTHLVRHSLNGEEDYVWETVDLYVHDDNGPASSMFTVIARFSDVEHDYISGVSGIAENPLLALAYVRYLQKQLA